MNEETKTKTKNYGKLKKTESNSFEVVNKGEERGKRAAIVCTNLRCGRRRRRRRRLSYPC